jgi:hypothetical protein
MLLVSPLVSAVQEEESETRVILVQTFKVARAEWGDFFDFMETYWIPSARANPHTIRYRLASHYFGITDPDIWLIAEYENLAALEEADSWAQQWLEERYPQGSTAREAYDASFEKYFLPYWSNHTDNILRVDMNHAK